VLYTFGEKRKPVGQKAAQARVVKPTRKNIQGVISESNIPHLSTDQV